jgi:hypothetical protein
MALAGIEDCGMTRNSPPTRKAQIEGLWAGGHSTKRIAEIIGCQLDYVTTIVGWAASRPKPVELDQGDHEKHLALVFRHGHGFPYYARVPV